MTPNAVTYRNSCLAVLVGDVGKSSSLCGAFERGKKAEKEEELQK